MKKTLQTVITAAMFAASMGSLPSEITETVSATDYNPYAEEMQDVYGPPSIETTATTTLAPVYGPPVAWNTTTESVQTTIATNEIPAPVYGPPLAWTTTSETDLPVPTTMPATIPLLPVYGPPAAWIGDLNEDDRIDVFDMIELKKAYLNSTTRDNIDLYRADINQDGTIGISDLVMLQNYLLGRTKKIYDNQIEEPKPTTVTQKSYINTETTATTTEPIPECVYGPPIAFD